MTPLMIIYCLIGVVVFLGIRIAFYYRQVDSLKDENQIVRKLLDDVSIEKALLYELSKDMKGQGPYLEYIERVSLDKIRGCHLSIFTFYSIRLAFWSGFDIGRCLLDFINKIKDSEKKEYFKYVFGMALHRLPERRLVKIFIDELYEEVAIKTIEIRHDNPGDEARSAFRKFFLDTMVENFGRNGRSVLESLTIDIAKIIKKTDTIHVSQINITKDVLEEIAKAYHLGENKKTAEVI